MSASEMERLKDLGFIVIGIGLVLVAGWVYSQLWVLGTGAFLLGLGTRNALRQDGTRKRH